MSSYYLVNTLLLFLYSAFPRACNRHLLAALQRQGKRLAAIRVVIVGCLLYRLMRLSFAIVILTLAGVTFTLSLTDRYMSPRDRYFFFICIAGYSVICTASKGSFRYSYSLLQYLCCLSMSSCRAVLTTLGFPHSFLLARL